MSKIELQLSEEYREVVDNNPGIIEALLGDYIELQQDKNTRRLIENDQDDMELTSKLREAVGI